jgi:lipoprotein-anchoring transpeptidase ErfK/SrfK
MRQRSFIVVALAVAMLVLGAVGVYAYDKTREDTIAKGVVAGGVDLGGLKPAAAREKLDRELAAPLRQPIFVRHGEERFRLGAREAKIEVDIDAMVDQALGESRKGNLISRTTRSLTGGEVEARIPVAIDYDEAVVDRFAEKVKEDVDQPAQDASIDFVGGGVQKVDSHNGREVSVKRFKRRIVADMTEPTSDHSVKVPLKVTKPEVTTAELAEKYPTVIAISRGGYNLTLYKDLKVVKTYRIAVGQAGLETPAGRYNIENKQVDPSWHVPQSDWAGDLAGQVIPPGPENPLKARWMGIYGGAGIHGTADVGSLGTSASHGCIRMAVPDVIDLYERVNVGDPVFIA